MPHSSLSLNKTEMIESWGCIVVKHETGQEAPSNLSKLSSSCSPLRALASSHAESKSVNVDALKIKGNLLKIVSKVRTSYGTDDQNRFD
jgi:hypothetical protein